MSTLSDAKEVATSLQAPKRSPFGSSLVRAIDSRSRFGFLGLTFLYALTVVGLSHFKLLWLDELITLQISALPTAGAIWKVLYLGVDPNPPLTHLLVHLSRVIFGENELALRLPAMVGYWLGLLSLFLYLKQRLSATWALAGTVLSMGMAAFDYSYESRSYGIFYGLTMLAFFLWTRAVDENLVKIKRRRALTGMTLALMAAISTNYFAVLAFLPIAAGELVSLVASIRYSPSGKSSRSLRWEYIQVWVALVLASLPLVFYRPLIERSIAQFAPYAWNKVSMKQVFDSYTQMVDTVLYPILAFLVLWLVVRIISAPFQKVCADCRERMRPRWLARFLIPERDLPTFPSYEVAGVLALMAYPFLGYVVASIRGGMLSPRFVIPVCLGFAIAAVVAAHQLFGGIPRASLVCLMMVTGWFLYREAWMGYRYYDQREAFYGVLDHLPLTQRTVPIDSPIVIPDPLLALTFQHYAPAAIARREVFPIDFPAIRAYQHDDSPEENLWAGRNSIYTLSIIPVALLQRRTGPYLVIATDDSWFLRDLSDHRYTFSPLPILIGANAIGGFTPLARGIPNFYLSAGDHDVSVANKAGKGLSVIPFRIENNLPDAK